jgi:hypothetical protein
MRILDKKIQTAERQFDRMNERLATFDDELNKLGLKGRAVLEAWDEYDKIQRLRQAQQVVDLRKFQI